MLRNLWDAIRETEWYAVIAMILLGGALVIAVLIGMLILPLQLGILAIVLTQAAIVSAVFSHRT